MWLPVHGTGTHKSDAFTFRSSLSATIIYNWKITNADSSIPEMQRRMAEFAAVRPYFYEDYYPLTGYGDMTGDDIWLAYQLLRPSDQTGYVVAFRRELCPTNGKSCISADWNPKRPTCWKKRRQRRPRGGHGPATDGRFHDEHRTAPLVVVDQIR